MCIRSCSKMIIDWIFSSSLCDVHVIKLVLFTEKASQIENDYSPIRKCFYRMVKQNLSKRWQAVIGTKLSTALKKRK
jgi:hypothetical protein